MDCIETDNDVATARLLTQADKIAELEKLFAKYRRKNDVFLPDDSFYKEIAGPEDAERMAASIFSWLGVKHRSITFHIDPKHDQLVV